MTLWMALIHLGDIRFTVPVAVAISTWLLASRAWRMAFWWSALFALGIGVVGASKIAFLAWGGGLPLLGFKAFSGHATGATAVLPMLFYLVLDGHRERLRRAGAGAGLALGGLVGVLLVILGEHTAAEALAGCIVGALVSIAAIGQAGAPPLSGPRPALLWSALMFIGVAWLISLAPVGYWMIKAARILSGNDRHYTLATADTD